MSQRKPTCYIFVTGGVISGLGKGITAASLGAVFRARGLKVSMQKCDPYLNVDAGTLSPAEHGECFVTKDGAETDLDLGHYERFLDTELTQASSTMAGNLLQKLIANERAGKFLGKTVQLVPHFVGAIQEAIQQAGRGSDVHIVEIGGTVGDYEALPFIEAIREMAIKVPGRCAFAHVVYMPFLGTTKEFKSKPVQNGVRDLRSLGIVPDLLIVRTEDAPPKQLTEKIALFAGLDPADIVMLPTARTVYQVPRILEQHDVSARLLRKLRISERPLNMKKWDDIIARATAQHPRTLKIGLVAKYLHNEDAYLSVVEALKSAAWANKVAITLEWVNAEKLERQGTDELKKYDGLVVPGGFGSRGIEGKITAARYAMDNKVPYLGLCLGLQVAVIAAVRKAGLAAATSEEITPGAPHRVIYIMQDQKGKEATGGTMRLGNYKCMLKKGSLAAKTYRAVSVEERHRHRYEVNQKYAPHYSQAGLVVSGLSPDGRLVEMIELQDHPYFLATQAHPEFRSRPNKPHPLFDGFIATCAAVQVTGKSL